MDQILQPPRELTTFGIHTDDWTQLHAIYEHNISVYENRLKNVVQQINKVRLDINPQKNLVDSIKNFLDSKISGRYSPQQVSDIDAAAVDNQIIKNYKDTLYRANNELSKLNEQLADLEKNKRMIIEQKNTETKKINKLTRQKNEEYSRKEGLGWGAGGKKKRKSKKRKSRKSKKSGKSRKKI